VAYKTKSVVSKLLPLSLFQIRQISYLRRLFVHYESVPFDVKDLLSTLIRL